MRPYTLRNFEQMEQMQADIRQLWGDVQQLMMRVPQQADGYFGNPLGFPEGGPITIPPTPQDPTGPGNGGGGSRGRIGKILEACPKGSSTTVYLYTGNGLPQTDSGQSVVAANTFADIAANRWVSVQEMESPDNWFIVAAECGA